MELVVDMYLYIEASTEEEAREKRDDVFDKLIKIDKGIDYQIFGEKLVLE